MAIEKARSSSRFRRWTHIFSLAVAGLLSFFVLAWNAGIARLEWDGARAARAAGVDSFVATEADERAADRSRYHLLRLQQDGDIPGLAVAVVREGTLVWSEAIGFADVEDQRPAKRDTRFRIQSLSKTLTASALMRLRERGDVDLDAPVQRYVPSFPDKGAPITLRHLASHRSGIRGYRDDSEALVARHCEAALDAVARFQDDPLVFAPDTDSVYSNYGYMLLGAALEHAGGEPFPDVMRRQVLEPLDMRNTSEFRMGPEHPDASAAYDVVTPYSSDGTRVRSPLVDFTCRWPSGGFLSTAEDMARFAAAHRFRTADAFLQPESLRIQFEPRTPPGSPIGIALGWLVGRDWRLRRVVFTFGAGSGGRAFMAVYPDHDVSVAIVANLGHARMDIRRLVGITVPFLEARRSPLPEVAGVLTAFGWIRYLARRRSAGPSPPSPKPIA